MDYDTLILQRKKTEIEKAINDSKTKMYKSYRGGDAAGYKRAQIDFEYWNKQLVEIVKKLTRF